MNVNGKPMRTIWVGDDGKSVTIIDQTYLPHKLQTTDLNTLEDAVSAIADMKVRGAPCIGATAAYGMAVAVRNDPSEAAIKQAYDALNAARPTAVNLKWALDECMDTIDGLDESDRASALFQRAGEICDEDVDICSKIGDYGLDLLKNISKEKEGDTVNILTHCNAGWVATVDWGTAIAPIYKAFDAGLDVHVWVDETRPRSQGARLTAWELEQHGVPYTVITDNSGGHLMQNGLVDICIVGTDRTTATGDVCNKIGTYLKALAAFDNEVPFYVGAPSRSIDWEMQDGLTEIPIEVRSGEEEVGWIFGRDEDGVLRRVTTMPDPSKSRNDAFDVTPREYITGLITERGVCDANRDALRVLFPEKG
ncbi:MAG: S-methyl-5-thioribose-1-phosphate isomerase [Acidimicrobiales bacterium]|nr:S-methyl-5-thioribose-1-phosphate isomerase [Hyphomonadaceae bacterium]RZV36409.1 MAG: S-methyl-5-thioribose-1-phosphate isomerase [Acidimicrobiales bacterium]